MRALVSGCRVGVLCHLTASMGMKKVSLVGNDTGAVLQDLTAKYNLKSCFRVSGLAFMQLLLWYLNSLLL